MLKCLFKVGSDEKVMYELHDKKLPLNKLADNIFDRNKEFVVENIKSNLTNIDSFGSTFRDSIKYINKIDLLNAFASDKLLGSYGAEFANKEISKIQAVESAQKLEQNKQIEERQKENQVANEPVARVKSNDFEMGD
ncbi:MAG: hypothetical protein RCG15_07665 [Candidatus Rickettsia vulgarisii]